VGIFLAMNMMAFSGISYGQHWYGHGGQHHQHGNLESLFAYLLMLMCTVVIATMGMPLAADAVNNLVHGGETVSRSRRWVARIDVNLLICVGVLAAFVVSVWNTLRGQGGLYYDTAAMILTLVTLGHYLDSSARRKAMAAARQLVATLPQQAFVREGDDVRAVSADDVQPGDVVRVRPGERLPVDGVVRGGESHVQEANLTGESRPRSVCAGDHVRAGTTAVDGLLWIEARAVGAARLVAQMQRLLEQARLSQPPIQRIADRITAWFVPGVVLLAIAAGALHAGRDGWFDGLMVALSVMLISCPCALGLAAPLATFSALRRAAACGILIDSAATLERLAAVRHLLLDKTGTLTDPALQLQRIVAAPDMDEAQALTLAAAVESASTHPVAHALVQAAAARGLATPAPSASRVLPGLGIEAVIAGQTLRLGSTRLAQQQGATPLIDDDGQSVLVHLMQGSRTLATFALAESLKAGAADLVEQCRQQGVKLTLLSGDAQGPVRRIASMLGIDAHAALLPADKLEHLQKLREQGAGPVAMVGDGVNDAPVLAGADVGFAVVGATDLAQQAGHVRLLSDRLDRVPLAIALSRHAMARVRWNLFWAFGYNGIGLTLAVLGILTPIFAASTMIVSSLLIVATSRRAGAVGDADERLHAPAESPAVQPQPA
jgi:Cu+-exporting ATPase